MKAYGHDMQAPIDCCPGHTNWAVQSKHTPRGARFDRDASRRAPKKAARRLARIEIAEALAEEA